MLLAKYKNPVEIQRKFRDEFDKFFDGFFSHTDFIPGSLYSLSPKADIEETVDDYKLYIELPGVDKKDIKLNVENNTLVVKGEKKQEKENNGKNFISCERNYGAFQRVFDLPGGIKSDKIEAEFKDGVLNIKVPKSEEAKKKKIEIKIN